jgi:hypothetical protein
MIVWDVVRADGFEFERTDTSGKGNQKGKASSRTKMGMASVLYHQAKAGTTERGDGGLRVRSKRGTHFRVEPSQSQVGSPSHKKSQVLPKTHSSWVTDRNADTKSWEAPYS